MTSDDMKNMQNIMNEIIVKKGYINNEQDNMLDDVDLFFEYMEQNYGEIYKHHICSKISVKEYIDYLEDWGDVGKAQYDLSNCIRENYAVEERIKRALKYSGSMPELEVSGD